MIHMLVGGFLFTVGSIFAVVFVRYCGPGLMEFMREVRDEMDDREDADRIRELERGES
jgi:hypothetical protein